MTSSCSGAGKVKRVLPSMVALLGRMVMAPSATSSKWLIGPCLVPQLSDPTQMKCPTLSALFTAAKTCLGEMKKTCNSLTQSGHSWWTYHQIYWVLPKPAIDGASSFLISQAAE